MWAKKHLCVFLFRRQWVVQTPVFQSVPANNTLKGYSFRGCLEIGETKKTPLIEFPILVFQKATPLAPLFRAWLRCCKFYSALGAATHSSPFEVRACLKRGNHPHSSGFGFQNTTRVGAPVEGSLLRWEGPKKELARVKASDFPFSRFSLGSMTVSMDNPDWIPAGISKQVSTLLGAIYSEMQKGVRGD